MRVIGDIELALRKVPIQFTDHSISLPCQIESLDIVEVWVVSFTKNVATVAILISFKIIGYGNPRYAYERGGISDFCQDEHAVVRMEVGYDSQNKGIFSIRDFQFEDLEKIWVEV